MVSTVFMGALVTALLSVWLRGAPDGADWVGVNLWGGVERASLAFLTRGAHVVFDC